MCDCGKTSTGQWMGKVGGQMGDAASMKFNNMMQSAQKRFKDWSGFGDYKLVGNSLMGMNSEHIETSAGRHGGIVIKFREYLGDVSVGPVSGAFNVTKYPINPSLFSTFPWASTLALNFDQWVPMGIIFEFKTTTTDATTNSAIGSVIAATFYDINDPDPKSKQEMLNSAYSSESKMSEDMVHGIECDPMETNRKVFYTHLQGSTPSGDIADYDMGNFYIATQGGNIVANTLIGSLYIHYQVMLLKNKLYCGIPAKDQLFQTFKYSQLTTFSPNLTAICASANWTAGVNLGMIFQVSIGTSQTIQFPATLAGAMILIEGWYVGQDGYIDGFPPTTLASSASFNGCSGVYPFIPSTFNPESKGPTPYTYSTGVTNCIPSPLDSAFNTANGGKMNTCYWSLQVLLNAPLSTAGATVTWGSSGALGGYPYTINGGPGTANYQMTFTIIPRASGSFSI